MPWGSPPPSPDPPDEGDAERDEAEARQDGPRAARRGGDSQVSAEEELVRGCVCSPLGRELGEKEIGWIGLWFWHG